jgi:hypothetical protein
MRTWLEDSRAIYWANRAGVKNRVPLSELPEALARLVSRGVIKNHEAEELLKDLKGEFET